MRVTHRLGVMTAVLSLGALSLLAVSAGALSLGYQTTTRASVSSTGVEGNRYSSQPVLSADSRYVAFTSTASNLVTDDNNVFEDVFVRDLTSGETTRVSVSSSGTQGDGHSYMPALSADGRLVAFRSQASNLVVGDTNAADDVFVRDLTSGETTRVSVSSTGVQGNGGSFDPALSADGLRVAFASSASNLVDGDTNGVDDVFVRNLASGETTLVSISSTGLKGNAPSSDPSLSSDGLRVAFGSQAITLVADDTNGWPDVFVRDLTSGQTMRVSVSSDGLQGNGLSETPMLSADGRYVVFGSEAANLVVGDSNVRSDVFVRDLVSGSTIRASVFGVASQGDGSSSYPAISADGRHVAFASNATNLVAGDTNGWSDIFVRDLVSGKTTRESVSSAGAQGNHRSEERPALSVNGRYVAFGSEASNLVAGDTNGYLDVFVRDRMRGSSLAVTSPAKTLSAYGASYTFTGRLVSGTTPLAGRRVILQSSSTTSGFATTSLGATTTADGTFSISVTPRNTTYYRARFAGEGAEYDASTSVSVKVVPRAWVSTPIAPTSMSKTRSATVYGFLKPRHVAGSTPVRIYRWRYVSGAWKSYGYVNAKAADYLTYTRYSAAVKLPYAGKWRLRAQHPADAGHAASWSSGFDYVTVR